MQSPITVRVLMGDWNFADVYERIARKIPDAPSQVQGDRVVTWAEWDRRANGLARHLLDSGLEHLSKVAAYLYNGPEYLETYLACFKVGMAPLNTNYRYGPEEITYIFDNADAECIVFHDEFAPLLDKIREQLPKVKAWVSVEDGNPRPDWATPYEDIVAAGTDEPVIAPWGRSGDDYLLIYTGGTTGMPKGVMWRQDDLFMVLGGGGNPILGTPPATDLDDLEGRIFGPGASLMPACPLMHGTGQFSSFLNLNGGGSIVCMEGRNFDADRLWRTVEEKKVNAVVIVGDAFARPMLAALEANPGGYDLSSLLVITSSGVMWSRETKQGLLEHLKTTIMYDSLGSSEAVGLAASVSTADQAAETAKFTIGERVKVLMEDGTEVTPGSEEVGMVSIAGYMPLGYYKDDAKTAATFRTVDGVRYSIPGDFASVDTEGGIHLLGRGSVVINTGGEKVFPEEVDEVLKQHPAVRDAVCVGLPDERFGETICALVECEDGETVEAEDLVEHVRGKLARYKSPRQIVFVDSMNRAPNGKLDYKALKAVAAERAGTN